MSYGEGVIGAPGTIHYEDGQGNDLFINIDIQKATVLTAGHDAADFTMSPVALCRRSAAVQLAKDVLTMAVNGGMPATYWLTDSRVLRACEVLGIEPGSVAQELADKWLCEHEMTT